MGISVHSLPLNAHKINVAYKPKYPPHTHTNRARVYLHGCATTKAGFRVTAGCTYNNKAVLLVGYGYVYIIAHLYDTRHT